MSEKEAEAMRGRGREGGRWIEWVSEKEAEVTRGGGVESGVEEFEREKWHRG